MRGLMMAIGIVFLSGCAQYQWVKRGASPADFQRDDYACRDEAARLPPPQQVPQAAVADTAAPGQTDCRAAGDLACAGAQEAPAVAYADENEKRRRFARWDCLSAKGWELTRVR